MIDIRSITGNMAVKPKPCPFCGGTAMVKRHVYRKLLKKHKLTSRFYVECIKCGAQTSLYKSWVELEEAWNRRTHDR